MKESILIILGWLLGILSPSIIKKISEKNEKKNLKKIIINDLKDLKKRLAPLPYLVYPRYGKLDNKIFEWIKENSIIDFQEGLEKMREQGIEENDVIILINREGLKKNTLSHFKKMHLFATDSHLMNLAVIDADLIEKVLEIRFHVEAFNESVDNFRDLLKMTFQSDITEANHKIISTELENISIIIAGNSIYIVDKINDILKLHTK